MRQFLATSIYRVPFIVLFAMEVHCVTGFGFDSNIYIVPAEKPIIVDTGTGLYTDRVLKRVTELGMKGKIMGIVLTHRHIDHVGGAYRLAKELKCDIFASSGEAAALRPGNDASTCASDVGIDLPKLDVRDLEGRLDCGDSSFDVIPAPGHTAGHIVLYERKSGTMFCGDVLFCDGGVGRWDLPTGDYKALVKSVEKLSKMDVKNLYPGHGSFARGDGNSHVSLALNSLKDCGGF